MDEAVKYHLGKNIKEKIRLEGGYTFQTWLLILSDNQKVVFRGQRDFDTGGGRKIIISDVLEREKYFYDTVNQVIGHICPKIYVIDSTLKYYDMSYCIMEYIEGIPLISCFNNFDIKTRNDILIKIGKIAAMINSIEIDINHQYIANRKSWEEYVSNRLKERFKALENNNVITQEEIEKICENMRFKKASNNKSFLHLDMRHANMIYNNGSLFILDAENCEFGDPLFDLATIDVAGEIDPILINSYKETYVENIDLDSELYQYYKMERLALVLSVFMNEVKNDIKSTQEYLLKFNNNKKKLLEL
jgi:fructosamine-3-kinase